MIKKILSKKTKNGFTLVEVMVVLSVVAIITVALFSNYGNFSGNVKLGDITYTLALSIREAQAYGSNSLSSLLEPPGAASYESFKVGYGVHFDSSDSYILFVDENNNFKYDASSENVIRRQELEEGYTMKSVCALDNYGFEKCIGGSLPIDYLDIAFERVNTGTRFSTDISGDSYQSARIILESSQGYSREVTVGLTGFITVSDETIYSSPSIEVLPETLSFTDRDQISQLTATIRDQNGYIISGQPVDWSSQDISVATVSNGAVTSRGEGDVIIEASFKSISDTVGVTVTLPPESTDFALSPTSYAFYDVDKPNASQTKQFIAIVYDQNGLPMPGEPITWSIVGSNPTGPVATVDATGLVTAKGEGDAILTASSGAFSLTANISVYVPLAPDSVVVSPDPYTFTNPNNKTFTATVYDQKSNPMTGQPIIWSSSNTDFATVSSNGVVTPKGAGTVEIIATSGSISGKAVVSVPQFVGSISVSPNPYTFTGSNTKTFTATVRDQTGYLMSGQSVTWSSSNTYVATVNSNGVVTPKIPGTAEIIATIGSVSDKAVVKVPSVPTTVTILQSSTVFDDVNISGQFLAVVRDQIGALMLNQPITWSSSDTSVATISSTGVVTSKSAGTTVIKATSGSIYGTYTLTVTVPGGSGPIIPGQQQK